MIVDHIVYFNYLPLKFRYIQRHFGRGYVDMKIDQATQDRRSTYGVPPTPRHNTCLTSSFAYAASDANLVTDRTM